MIRSVTWMADHFGRLFARCLELRSAGQKEYAGKTKVENTFGNFVRLSEKLDLTPEKVLWVFATKHIDGIESYLNGHKSQRESVHGRIGDLIVYLGLLDGMIRAREEDEGSVAKQASSAETLDTIIDQSRKKDATAYQPPRTFDQLGLMGPYGDGPRATPIRETPPLAGVQRQYAPDVQ